MSDRQTNRGNMFNEFLHSLPPSEAWGLSKTQCMGCRSSTSGHWHSWHSLKCPKIRQPVLSGNSNSSSGMENNHWISTDICLHTIVKLPSESSPVLFLIGLSWLEQSFMIMVLTHNANDMLESPGDILKHTKAQSQLLEILRNCSGLGCK